jgi:hypothetical protein
MLRKRFKRRFFGPRFLVSQRRKNRTFPARYFVSVTKFRNSLLRFRRRRAGPGLDNPKSASLVNIRIMSATRKREIQERRSPLGRPGKRQGEDALRFSGQAR